MEKETIRTLPVTKSPRDIVLDTDIKNTGEMIRYFRQWLGKNVHVYPLLDNPRHFRVLSASWISVFLSIPSVANTSLGINSQPLKLTLKTLWKMTLEWMQSSGVMHYWYREDILRDIGTIFEIDTLLERSKLRKKESIFLEYSDGSISIHNTTDESLIYNLYERWYSKKWASRIYEWLIMIYGGDPSMEWVAI